MKAHDNWRCPNELHARPTIRVDGVLSLQRLHAAPHRVVCTSVHSEGCAESRLRHHLLKWSGHAESEQGFVNATRPTQPRTSQRLCQVYQVWISLLARKQQERSVKDTTSPRRPHAKDTRTSQAKDKSKASRNRSRIHPASGPEASRPGAPPQSRASSTAREGGIEVSQ